MWNPTERRSAMARLPLVGLLLALTILALPAAAAPQADAPVTPADTAELRRSLGQYEAIAITDGVLLKPRVERLGVRSIEVTTESIAVNGERVTAGVLRAWLGEEAEPILALQALSNAERRALVGLTGEGRPAPAETPAPAAEGEATAEPAEPEELPELEELAEPAEADAGRRRYRGTGSRVNIGGGVTVDADEVAEEVVAIGGAARIDGEVDRDVVAVGGPVRVNGTVGGEVVSVGGGVYLGPHARVDDNVTSIGGSVHKEEGAVVGGAVQEIGMFPFVWGDWGDGWHGHWDWDWDSPWWWFGGVSGTIGSVMGMLLAMGLVCLVLFIAPRPVERVDRQLVAQPWACLGAGLAAGLGFLPALALLTILTCCLLILVYPFLFLVVGWFVLLGYATVARRLGWYLSRRFGWNLANPYLAALIGVVVIEIWSIVGHLLALPGLVPFAWMFEAFDFAIGLAALLVGTGAVVLARFGAAPGYWDRGGVPPAPPVPQPAEPGQPASDLPLSASGNPPE